MQQRRKIKLLNGINKNIIDLCQNQYGNYVIQHLLEKRGGENCPQIYEVLKGRIFDMSIHKFASNVIEKCLHYGTNEQKANLINELLSKDDNVHDSLISLVKDKFGNYVVQKMIEYAPDEQRKQIIEHIINNPELKKKKETFAKHVISYIEKKGYINNNSLKNNQNMQNNNNVNINNISENNNYLQGMNLNDMNIHSNNNHSENNIFGVNNLQELQFMNNNNNSNFNDKYFGGNLGIMNNNINNYNNNDFDNNGQEGQED